jgi:hypothetical protein
VLDVRFNYLLTAAVGPDLLSAAGGARKLKEMRVEGCRALRNEWRAKIEAVLRAKNS